MTKPEANKRQVGGSHYSLGDYQHWDWAIDCRIGILEYGATRYVIRIKKPEEDYQKALHFIEKIKEEYERYRYFPSFVKWCQEDTYGVADLKIFNCTEKLSRNMHPELVAGWPWAIQWCNRLARWENNIDLDALADDLQRRLPA